MATIDNFDLVKKSLDLPWYNLILISLLIIPIFITAWNSVIPTIFGSITDSQKRIFGVTFVLVYFIGLTIGKIGHDKDHENYINKVIVNLKNDLNSNGGILGFKRIRERHPSYDEKMLYQIADDNPSIFLVTPIADATNPALRDKDDPFGLKLQTNRQ